MDELVRPLTADARILDLGAGGGSFSYSSTAAAVLAVDLDFPPAAQPCFARLIADSRHLPLASNSVDVVVCNHTLEHFENPDQALAEVGRLLKEGGHLWIAVPDGHLFDDKLYRFLFHGGGHVNRFSLESLISLTESSAGTRAVRFKKLHTGFVYLNPPDPLRLRHYPRRARNLARIPPSALRWIVRWLNWGVRMFDRVFSTRTSQYGWGVVFRRLGEDRGPGPAPGPTEMVADRNVCFRCGAGHPAETLKPLLRRRLVFWKTYDCPCCGELNLYSR